MKSFQPTFRQFTSNLSECTNQLLILPINNYWALSPVYPTTSLPSLSLSLSPSPLPLLLFLFLSYHCFHSLAAICFWRVYCNHSLVRLSTHGLIQWLSRNKISSLETNRKKENHAFRYSLISQTYLDFIF